MSKKNNVLERIIKRIRLFTLVNVPVRVLVKLQIRFHKKVFIFFSKHWPVSGIIKFKLPQKEEVKIYSKGDDYVSTLAFWNGYEGYEGPSIRLFYYLSKKSSVVFDIGAHIGYFTLIGAKSNPAASFYSFEPVAYIFSRLKENIKINKLTNVLTTQSVVGSSETPVKFYVPEGNTPFAGSTKKGWAADATETIISSVSIGAFKQANKIAKIDLVKMDCEFHEVEVLAGMRDVLRDDKPIVLMEVLFPEGEGQKGHFELVVHLEIERIMKENGYYFYLISNEALIKVDKLEYNPYERNYLFSTKNTEKVYNSYSDMDSLMKNIF